MWLYLVALVALYHLVRWYRERQVVSQLQDKYVFITGCDSGFRKLLAKQLDQRGLRVLAACHREKGAELLRAQTSNRLDTVILDVTNSESIAVATQWVKERTGDTGLWGLVNNAGITGLMAPNEWLTKKDFMKTLEVNLLGVIEVTLSLLSLLRKARGRVVNVSSVAGRISLVGGGYSISKFGLEAFSDSLRRELSFFGVKVAVIKPGNFKTKMNNFGYISQKFWDAWDQASPEVKDIYGENSLMAYECTGLDQTKGNNDLSLVTDCLEHALVSCHPRTQYSAGWDAKFTFIPLSYMPTFLVDALLKRRMLRPVKTL
ncbi:retinol dehydrogenase 16-like [Sorex fumeus]|uniref:retinol dehydrogenase 16-like n=1 Tax=Sorex fumeus TaxID=62283 RepID=UPI0024ADA9E4|nr:retinol dehydrogenase 16-like [Sorex fumeus]